MTREHCRCLDDDEYGRNPDGECFCYESGTAYCGCERCQADARAGRADFGSYATPEGPR